MTPRDVFTWRAKRGLSQQEAAGVAQVHLRTWQRWEYGERKVPRWLPEILALRWEEE